MKKRYVILVGFATLLAVAVALRWPRLDPENVSVTRSRAAGTEMIVEYRMSRPFEVAMGHGIREPVKWPKETGFYVGNSRTMRKEKVGVISSNYDLLRGEHYVRLQFLRGPALTIEGNGHRIEVMAWSVADAKGMR